MSDVAINAMVNGFEDELEKCGFKIPGIGAMLRGGLKKAPLAGLIAAPAAGAGAIGFQAGEEKAEKKIPAAFSMGAQLGAEAQAEQDYGVIMQLQQALNQMAEQALGQDQAMQAAQK